MLIDFENPIQPIDEYSQRAFIEILNIILLADNIIDIDQKLFARNKNDCYRSLSGYYKWSFDNYSFTLWQRLGYKSPLCFKNKILEIKHITLLCEDRKRPDSRKN